MGADHVNSHPKSRIPKFEVPVHKPRLELGVHAVSTKSGVSSFPNSSLGRVVQDFANLHGAISRPSRTVPQRRARTRARRRHEEAR